jgi:glycosyltransferase involved in cell wall biosynthesis
VTVSIVIPMKNAERTLERCLAAIAGSAVAPLETIVVDDGSTDRSLEIAARFPVRVVPGPSPGGVSSARNLGARRASGDVLFFTDSDVVIGPATLGAIVRRLADTAVDGIVGVPSQRRVFNGFLSDYKNLWLRYTYLRLDGDLSVLYSSVVAIRREAFERSEGFDARYRRPNIEDSDLGKRLAERGVRLRVAPEVEIVHLKEYDLRSFLVTDFLRSSGLLKVQLRDRFRTLRGGNYTSIPTPFIVSVVLSWAPIAALAAPGGGLHAAGASCVAAATAVVFLNRDLLRFFLRVRGPAYVLRILLLLPIDFAAITLGLAHGLAGYVAGRRW